MISIPLIHHLKCQLHNIFILSEEEKKESISPYPHASLVVNDHTNQYLVTYILNFDKGYTKSCFRVNKWLFITFWEILPICVPKIYKDKIKKKEEEYENES